MGHFHPNPICIGGCDENILNILGINKNRFNTGNQSQPNSTSAVDRFNSNRNLGNLFNSGRTFNRSTTQTSNNTNRNQTGKYSHRHIFIYNNYIMHLFLLANVRSKRKCGICRQEGHTRNNCPQNN